MGIQEKSHFDAIHTVFDDSQVHSKFPSASVRKEHSGVATFESIKFLHKVTRCLSVLSLPTLCIVNRTSLAVIERGDTTINLRLTVLGEEVPVILMHHADMHLVTSIYSEIAVSQTEVVFFGRNVSNRPNDSVPAKRNE